MVRQSNRILKDDLNIANDNNFYQQQWFDNLNHKLKNKTRRQRKTIRINRNTQTLKLLSANQANQNTIRHLKGKDVISENVDQENERLITENETLQRELFKANELTQKKVDDLAQAEDMIQNLKKSKSDLKYSYAQLETNFHKLRDQMIQGMERKA